MREIKFRIWIIATETMMSWEELLSHKNAPTLSFIENEKNGITVNMQYTGLKDKNKVEIYDGDIVKGKIWTWEKERNRLVRFDKDEYGWQPFVDREETCEGLDNIESYSCEVIGNIYENKNLLEED